MRATNRVSADEAKARRLGSQEESVAATDKHSRRLHARVAGVSVEHEQYRSRGAADGIPAAADSEASLPARMECSDRLRTGAGALPGVSGSSPRVHVTAHAIKGVLSQRSPAARPAHRRARPDGEGGRRRPFPPRPAGCSHGEADWSPGADPRARPRGPQPRRGGRRRVAGVDPANGRRYACTTGFVVRNGTRNGIVTAAHCPDALTYYSPQGGTTELSFDGQWGWRYQDVQVHATEEALRPLFYADTAKTLLRTVTGARPRTSTRAGDFVCRRGETSGYSCAQVELVDYAPPGELCGGPCDPVWVTVPGPSCKGGDSGAPIFLGTVAFGIVKGGNYSRSGTCNFYYYMSTDYLPAGWGLMRG
jgi:hypothetical protein